MNESNVQPNNPASWNKPLWAAQFALALLFCATGAFKAFGSLDDMLPIMPWARETPWLPRVIGSCELAGALGLLLPAWTRILPVLTPVAASALAVVMVLAAGQHFAVEHKPLFGMGAALVGVACVFTAYGRLRKAPIAPR